MTHDVTELHNIMPLDNIPSVLHRGILSYEQAAKINLNLLPLQKTIQIPKGLKLHQYVSLYIDAYQSPMTEQKTEQSCILRISPEIFDIEGIVLCDLTPSDPYARYFSPAQCSSHCTIALVPVCIPFCFITGAYVFNETTIETIKNYGFTRELSVRTL
jgi:hypothetical protein